MRFTITRAVRGFSDDATHSANPRRRHVVAAPAGAGGKTYSFALATERTPDVISDPLASGTPRFRKYEGWGAEPESVVASAVGYIGGFCRSSSAILSLSS